MRRLAALLAVFSLFLTVVPPPVLAQGGSPPADEAYVDQAFLERCLGQVEDIEATEVDGGLLRHVLIVSTALLMPELLAASTSESDVWTLLGAGTLVLANGLLYLGAFESRAEDSCPEEPGRVLSVPAPDKEHILHPVF